MKAVLDIGSNSVRMIVFDGSAAVFRGKVNSRLAEGLSDSERLLKDAVARTVAAIGSLIKKAMSFDPDCGVFAFATEAVRRAKDGAEFLDAVREIYGLGAELLTGEEEAEIALYGVLGRGDGAVLDIGGASSELVIRKNGEVKYVNSLKTGAGILTDSFGNDKYALKEYLNEKVKDYGPVPFIDKLYLIGGTASACGLISKNLDRYDYASISGALIEKEELSRIVDGLFGLDVNERMKKYRLDENRATVLPCGAALLEAIMEYLSIKSATVSERGNIEGYYFSRLYRGGSTEDV